MDHLRIFQMITNSCLHINDCLATLPKLGLQHVTNVPLLNPAARLVCIHMEEDHVDWLWDPSQYCDACGIFTSFGGLPILTGLPTITFMRR